jgi:hypothetical protein
VSADEWKVALAALAMLGAFLLWTVRLVRDFVGDVKDIKTALLGDKYGNPGLVAEMASVKGNQERMAKRVDHIEARLDNMERTA